MFFSQLVRQVVRRLTRLILLVTQMMETDKRMTRLLVSVIQSFVCSDRAPTKTGKVMENEKLAESHGIL